MCTILLHSPHLESSMNIHSIPIHSNGSNLFHLSTEERSLFIQQNQISTPSTLLSTKQEYNEEESIEFNEYSTMNSNIPRYLLSKSFISYKSWRIHYHIT